MTKHGLALAILFSTACTKRHAKPDEDLYATSSGGGDRGPVDAKRREPVPTAAAWPVHVERWAALTSELATSLRAAATCPEVARAMRAFTTQHGKELSALQRQLVEWERSNPDKDVARFYRGVQGELNVRIDAGIRCRDDAAARSAFDQFFKVAGLDLR